MKKILIIGAGGHARVAIDYLRSYKVDIIGLLDDNKNLIGKKIGNIKVLGVIKDIIRLKNKFDECFVAFGDNSLRYNSVKLIEELITDIKFTTIKHQTAIVSESSFIGQGSFIGAGSIIGANTKIGEHNIINSGIIIEHECNLDDFVSVGPGARLASTIRVGERAFIGMGSCVIEDTKIGKTSIIGAGSVVLNDVPDNTLVVGVPARVKRKNE